MIHADTIAQMAQVIVDHLAPERILLFGSCAIGAQTADSDLDLLVVMSTDLPKSRRSMAVRTLFQPMPCPLDVLVYTPQEVAYWRGTANHIITMAFDTGKILYERQRPRPDDDQQEGTMVPRHAELCQEWLRKADHDMIGARAMLDLPLGPTDVACFHLQQAVEKALKALLTWRGWRFPRTHDLLVLQELAQPLLPDLADYRALLHTLTQCAVTWRYPGDEEAEPEREELLPMMAMADVILAKVRHICQS